MQNPDIQLHVSGYKSISETTSLTIKPLTLIAGTNSSGKSSFMQPFLMMKQTLDAQFDPGPLLLNGLNVNLTDWSQALSRKKARNSTSRSLGLGIAEGDTGFYNRYGWAPRNGLKLEQTSYIRNGIREEYSPGMTSVEIGGKFDPETTRMAEAYAKRLAARETPTRKSSRSQRDKRREVDVSSQLQYTIERQGCFFVPSMQIHMGDRSPFTLKDPSHEDVRKSIDSLVRGIIHIPGLRGNPERTYTSSAPGGNFPGLMEQYVASVIYGWETGRTDDKLKVALLGADLEKMGLTWKVHAARIDDVRIELQVGRLLRAQQGGAFDLVNIADVGFGVSQILPVLVALHVARRGQIVYMEQPELHLHPRAQMALGEILVTAANRGVRVVVETHSSLIIRSIQASVARRAISHEDVCLNWFSRNRDTGNTSIAVAELDELGRFGDWPIDFDDVAEEADFEFLTAVEEALDD